MLCEEGEYHVKKKMSCEEAKKTKDCWQPPEAKTPLQSPKGTNPN
jgi:hypothetical protein